MKIEYTNAKIELIKFLSEDIITTSAGDNDFSFGDINNEDNDIDDWSKYH